MMNTLVIALFEENTGHLLLPFINYTLAFLLVVIVATFLSGVHSIHLVVLGFLALGLMASVNWFVAELQKRPLTNEQPGDSTAEDQNQRDGSKATPQISSYKSD